MGPWCLTASTPPTLCCCTSEVFQGSRDDLEDLRKQKGSEKLEGVQFAAHQGERVCGEHGLQVLRARDMVQQLETEARGLVATHS